MVDLQAVRNYGKNETFHLVYIINDSDLRRRG